MRSRFWVGHAAARKGDRAKVIISMPAAGSLGKAIGILLVLFALLCTSDASSEPPTFLVKGTSGARLVVAEVARFDQPWAMVFLPDGSLLVTEKAGALYQVLEGGAKHEVTGVPEVAYGGQGGLGDVVLSPGFADTNQILISYVEADGRLAGAVVVRAALTLDSGGGGALGGIAVLWRQTPKVTGRGHFSHRIVFGAPNTEHQDKLLISSGDRQKLRPAQDMESSLGKIIRLNPDGTIPPDNPWADGSAGEIARSFWSLGHRNILGIAFDTAGRLWAQEMGPRHGDELNLIRRGVNYGWPVVSEGSHYNFIPIPSHDTRPEFAAPAAYWDPSIAPSGMIIYNGAMFPEWRDHAFIGGLVSRALIRVAISDTAATERERFAWGKRIREVEQAPDGAIYILEDGANARLLRLTPAPQ